MIEPIDIDGDGKISTCERLLFLTILLLAGKEVLTLLI